MKSNKEFIKSSVKLALGGVLIYYVLSSKMVDFESLQEVLWNPVNLILSIVFLGACAAFIATRWYFLVQAQGLSLSFKDVFALTMIGNFFNTFMPGSVGGDLIKAWYVAGKEPTRKTKAIFTVLLDRTIGLSVIISYAAVTLLFYYQWIVGHRELQILGVVIWGFTGACIVFASLFFSSYCWQTRWLQGGLQLMRKIGPLSKLLDAALLYQAHFRTIVIALAFSAVSITVTILLWAFQGAAMGIDLSLSEYFFVVPVGLTISAIPLLPGGIGVGQVAFFTLFQWIGMENPEQGGALCTLMQIYIILFNCIGAAFYVKYKRKPRAKSALESVTIPARRVSQIL